MSNKARIPKVWYGYVALYDDDLVAYGGAYLVHKKKSEATAHLQQNLVRVVRVKIIRLGYGRRP